MIKEVADVTFYELSDSGLPKNPVLYLDTLKVSTIEQTAEEAEARGGKGNAALIAWDFGKEINVTLEDALFSAKSMAIMFGDGSVKSFDSTTAQATDANADFIMKTIQVTCETAGTDPTGGKWTGPNGRRYDMMNPKFYDETGASVEVAALKADTKYFCTFDLKAAGSVIDVSANSFPGTLTLGPRCGVKQINLVNCWKAKFMAA